MPPTREREPKHAQGAPARPRIRAPSSSSPNIAIRAAARYAAASEPAATPTPRASSAAISDPHAAQRLRESAKPKVASAATLERGLASFSSAAPTSTAPMPRRIAVATISPYSIACEGSAANG